MSSLNDFRFPTRGIKSEASNVQPTPGLPNSAGDCENRRTAWIPGDAWKSRIGFDEIDGRFARSRVYRASWNVQHV